MLRCINARSGADLRGRPRRFRWRARGAFVPAPAGAALAGEEPLDPGSISVITWWNVASSMGRSVLPSQVEPSGISFWTLGAAASTCSMPPVLGRSHRHAPRRLESEETRSQSTCSLCSSAASATCGRATCQQLLLRLLPVARIVLQDVERLHVELVSCQPNTNGWFTTRTLVPRAPCRRAARCLPDTGGCSHGSSAGRRPPACWCRGSCSSASRDRTHGGRADCPGPGR